MLRKSETNNDNSHRLSVHGQNYHIAIQDQSVIILTAILVPDFSLVCAHSLQGIFAFESVVVLLPLYKLWLR